MCSEINTITPDSSDALIYLDYQSTTPCDSRVVKAMISFFTDNYANPHSEHHLGRQAYEAVEQARQQVADVIGATTKEIIFTSGATESNNLAIKGCVNYLLKQSGNKAKRVITVSTEHKTVLESINALQENGIEVVVLPVNREGLFNLADLRVALQIPTLLVSVMFANNETGIIHPIKQIASMVQAAGAIFHCDLTQGLGQLAGKTEINQLGIDLASFSAHKIYGPKGVGALYIRHKPRIRLLPFFSGGGQERNIRSGTLPVPLIVGFGKACKILQQEGALENKRLKKLRQKFLIDLQKRIPNFRVNGSLTDRLPENLNLCFSHIPALDILKRVPQLCISTGSACTAADIAPSYVLLAMGLSREEAVRSMRVSFGRMTNEKEIEKAINLLSDAWHQAMAENQIN